MVIRKIKKTFGKNYFNKDVFVLENVSSLMEFYWMLRSFWSKVELYSRPDPNIPLCVPVDINAKMNDLIAVCYDE